MKSLILPTIALLASLSASNGAAILYYDFDQAAPTDQVGSADLTLGSTTVSSALPAPSGGNHLVSSNTTGATALQANVPTIGTGDFSISFWMNVSDAGSVNKSIFDMQSGSSDGGLQLLMRGSDDKFALGAGGDAGPANFAGFPSSAAATGFSDTWTHVALTADRDGNLLYYVNGAQLGSGVSFSSHSTVSFGANMNLAIGGGDNSYSLGGGSVDDFAIYTDLLTPAQITSLSDGSKNPLNVLAPIPEPSTAALLGLGGFTLIMRRRRK